MCHTLDLGTSADHHTFVLQKYDGASLALWRVYLIDSVQTPMLQRIDRQCETLRAIFNQLPSNFFDETEDKDSGL